MLVLSRHRDESIIIGDDIVITVVDIRGDKVRLGIAAPIEISVHRQEVYEAIQRENRQASRLEPQEARQIERLNPPVRREVRRPRCRRGLRTRTPGRSCSCWHGGTRGPAVLSPVRATPIAPLPAPASSRAPFLGPAENWRPVCFHAALTKHPHSAPARANDWRHHFHSLNQQLPG